MPDRDDDATLHELRALADRTDPGSVEWEDPPPGLWARIAAEAGVDEPGPAGGDERDPGAVTPLEGARSRRRRRMSPGPWLAAAAAAIVLLVVSIGLITQRDDAPEVLAATSLDRLGDAGSGSAELVDDGGRLRLRLDTSGLDPGDGFHEVWVIDPDVTRLVSLGPLRADGEYDLPPGLDPAAFPIVDVSTEPIDGDPSHSGQSVLRGELEI